MPPFRPSAPAQAPAPVGDREPSGPSRPFAPTSQREAEPEKKQGIFSRIAGIGRRAGRELVGTFEKQVAGEITPAETGIRTLGSVAKGVSRIAGEALISGLKFITPDQVEESVKRVALTAVQTPLGQKGIAALESGIDAYTEFKKANPRAAENIEAVVNIAEFLPVERAGAAVARGAIRVGEAAKPAVRAGVEAVSSGFQARKATRLADVNKQVDELAQVVTQGKISDVPAARKALSRLDTTGVETFEDLSTAATDKVRFLSERQTAVLSAFPEPQPVKAFAKTTGKGAQRVTSNPVTQALDDLDELYTKVGDDQALVNVRALKEKADTDGITLDEVNKLAIEYGQEFGDRAFNPRTGVELTSVNAQRFETTRKSLKDSLRSKMPDEQSKLIDEEIGNLLTVRRLSKQMENKVGDVLKKVEKRGVLQKVGRTLGTGVDVLTGRSLSGFFTGLLVRGGVGLKTLDALTIQKNLNKNLKKLDTLFAKTDEAIEKTIIDEVIIAGLLPEGTIPLGPTVAAAAETAGERGVARVTGQLPSNKELFKTVFENQGMKAVQRGDEFLITRPGRKPFKLTEQEAKAMTDQGFEFTKVIDVQGVPVDVKSIFTAE